jgi:hypothetical protein
MKIGERILSELDFNEEKDSKAVEFMKANKAKLGKGKDSHLMLIDDDKMVSKLQKVLNGDKSWIEGKNPTGKLWTHKDDKSAIRLFTSKMPWTLTVDLKDDKLIKKKNEAKIDFAKIENGLAKDLMKLDKKAAKHFLDKWGADQIWGITGSVSGPSFAQDSDHMDMFKEMVAKFGKEKESELEKILYKWAYDYCDLKD